MTFPEEGIAVDAAHSQKNGKTEIQGIDLKTGKYLFYESLGNQTVNIGEFLAIVEAVKHIIASNYKPKLIWSDKSHRNLIVQEQEGKLAETQQGIAER